MFTMSLLKGLKSKMEFELVKIDNSNVNILENLFQLYLHDISYYLTFEVDNEGKFFAYDIVSWVQKSENFGYLIYSGGKLCGFVMVDRECLASKSEGTLNLSEIFVLNAYKGKGLASAVLERVFSEHKAVWEVRPVYKSVQAHGFWKKFFAGYNKKSELVEYKSERYAYIFSSK